MTAEFIVFRQTREQRFSHSAGEEGAFVQIEFKPIYGPQGKIPAESAEHALEQSKRNFPNTLLAVQPYTEFLECLQKQTLSQPFPRPSAQRRGS